MSEPRESFFDAQARHRAAARRWAWACALAATALAVVASFALTPPLLVLGVAVARAVQIVAPLPAVFWDGLSGIVARFDVLGRAAYEHRLTLSDVASGLRILGILMIPGMLVILLLWRSLRRSLIRDGGVGLGLALGARAPDGTDPEERQLVNVVEEMAIAAGMRPPGVLILDRDSSNAAALGTTPENATLVVAHGLLPTLDRSETQAVLGHLMAHIADGDLALGIETLAVAETFGVLMLLLEAPLDGSARRALGRVAGLLVRPWRRSSAERGRLTVLLTARLDPDTIDRDGRFIDDLGKSGGLLTKIFRGIRFAVLLPIFGVMLVVKMFLLLFTLFVIGPFLWSMQRRRRNLADATAVQLTRYPDALATALTKLAATRDAVGKFFPHLFVVSPSRGLVGPTGMDTTVPKDAGNTPMFLIGVHPPIPGRVKRLQKLGAALTLEEPAAAAPKKSFLDLPDVGIPLKIVALAIAAIFVVPLASFFLYGFGVAALFGGGAAIFAYWAALQVVAFLVVR